MWLPIDIPHTFYANIRVPVTPVGTIDDDNPERYTHAVFMRFQKKGDLLKFYENPFYLGVLQKHVMPYCHV